MTQSPDAGEAIPHQVVCIVFGMCSLSSLCTLGLQMQGQPQTMQKTKEEFKGGSKVIKKMQINVFESQNSHYPSTVPRSLLKRSVPLRHLRVPVPEAQAVAAGSHDRVHVPPPFCFCHSLRFPLSQDLAVLSSLCLGELCVYFLSSFLELTEPPGPPPLFFIFLFA